MVAEANTNLGQKWFTLSIIYKWRANSIDGIPCPIFLHTAYRLGKKREEGKARQKEVGRKRKKRRKERRFEQTTEGKQKERNEKEEKGEEKEE